MIHLPLKDITDPPAKLTSPSSKKLLRRVLVEKNGRLYSSSHYRDDNLKDLLRAYSILKTEVKEGDFPKCNYCESQGEKSMVLEVEHFRPKAKVDLKDNKNIPHQGYYWLGLEWSNLLLACPNCNGKSAKGNRFPIRGKRADEPENEQFVMDRGGCLANEYPLIEERPLLINPEVDYPEDFFTFDTTGRIKPHGADLERGKISMEIYNLNRPILVSYRIQLWESFKKEILLDIASYELGEIKEETLNYCFAKTARKIIERRLPEMEFTLWGRFINDEIKDFIYRDIPEKFRDEFYGSYLIEIERYDHQEI